MERIGAVVSDVQLYTTALSTDQISSVMGGDLAEGADLYVRYPLDDGADSDVVIGTGPGAVDDGALIDNLDAGLGDDGFVWVDDEERGTVLTFAGTWVDAGELPLMDAENDFTWNFWSKSDGGQAQTSGNIIMGNRTDFGNAGEGIAFTNNRIEFAPDASGGRSTHLEWGPAGPDDDRMPNNNEWFHHVVVKEGDLMTYYRNGQPRSEVSLGLAQQTADPLPFAMGGQAAPDSPGGETPITFLSDVRLYSSALTSAEVAELAGVSLEPTCEDIAAGRVPGDADGSGDVGFLDFLALANNFGSDGGFEGGDFDCNGDVNFLDFLTLANNFGNTAAAEASSVPEPSGALLFGFGFALLGLARRRR